MWQITIICEKRLHYGSAARYHLSPFHSPPRFHCPHCQERAPRCSRRCRPERWSCRCGICRENWALRDLALTTNTEYILSDDLGNQGIAGDQQLMRLTSLPSSASCLSCKRCARGCSGSLCSSSPEPPPTTSRPAEVAIASCQLHAQSVFVRCLYLPFLIT